MSIKYLINTPTTPSATMTPNSSRNKFILYTMYYILIVTLFPTTLSLPRHRDSEYLDEEPEAIPVHLLRIPMQVDVPDSKIEDFPQFSTAFKRNGGRNHLAFSDSTESCCPINREIIEPIAGKNRQGDLVELYQTENVRQRFYEISCAPSVADKPCRYLDKRHTSLSRCEQQYSYTYALVRDLTLDSPGGSGNGNSGGSSTRRDRGWRLDYILVRSGCSCQISAADD